MKNILDSSKTLDQRESLGDFKTPLFTHQQSLKQRKKFKAITVISKKSLVKFNKGIRNFFFFLINFILRKKLNQTFFKKYQIIVMNFPKLLINWFDILGRSVLHITVYNLNLAEVNSLINMGIAEKLINFSSGKAES